MYIQHEEKGKGKEQEKEKEKEKEENCYLSVKTYIYVSGCL